METLNNPPTTASSVRRRRAEAFARLVILGAVVGLLTGLWEARLLASVPSIRGFLVVDAAYVIWFLAPLVDTLLFAALGAVLGVIAALVRFPNARINLVFFAGLLGIAGAHIAWALHFVHSKSVIPAIYSRYKDLLFPLGRFAVVFVLALVILHLLRNRLLPLFSVEKRWPLGKFLVVLIVVLVTLAGGVFFYAPLGKSTQDPAAAAASQPSARPNIVLITMDTVRADHLSAYGYYRSTTPNLDRLASEGVLFRNAIAATSWTLPSLASIFTGLLPHQHGANAARMINPGWVTLGGALQRYGYQTAGFNANIFYGQAGWGFGRGFGLYDDDPSTTPYNVARTLVGRALIQPVYQRLDAYDAFFRRDAGALNAEVFRWLKLPHSQPYYVYINYFDAHSPYAAPAPFHQRFGALSGAVLQRWGFATELRPAAPVPAAERQALMNGYDDALAYIDAQIGDLVSVLKDSPEWKNTIVVITADHGEAFGEHGAYQHACDLHQEEIHVPLIIFGAGIPAGRQVTPAVPIRNLFSTILDLALGSSIPMHRNSLARFWQPGGAPNPVPPVVSELSASRAQQNAGEISLTTSQWHYVRQLSGEQELYDWAMDPKEEHNLSSSTQYRNVMDSLQDDLQEIIADSYEPWIGREYLLPLGQILPPAPSKPATSKFSSGERERVGGAQAYFRPSVSTTPQGPDKSEKENLNSLPYQ